MILLWQSACLACELRGTEPMIVLLNVEAGIHAAACAPVAEPFSSMPRAKGKLFVEQFDVYTP